MCLSGSRESTEDAARAGGHPGKFRTPFKSRGLGELPVPAIHETAAVRIRIERQSGPFCDAISRRLRISK